MPTVVLEAMAFGLPILTRNVGGLVDFFKNDKMGFITDSLEPKDFSITPLDKSGSREGYGGMHGWERMIIAEVGPLFLH